MATFPQLKVNVLREEYLALTGDPMVALVLNQLVYWTGQTEFIDRYLLEESARRMDAGESAVLAGAVTEGWIVKSAADMARDALLPVSENTMRGYLTKLVNKGLVHSRQNPRNPFDRQLQYRVDLLALNTALAEHGYGPVPGFHVPSPLSENVPSTRKNCVCTNAETAFVPLEDRIKENHGDERNHRDMGAEMERSIDAPAPPPVVASLPIQEEGSGRASSLNGKARKRKAAGPAERDPNLDHPAVITYRTIACLTPNAIKREAIAAAFPAPSESALAEWTATIKDWIAHDWNKANVQGMLDYHAKRVPAPRLPKKMLGDGVVLPEIHIPVTPIRTERVALPENGLAGLAAIMGNLTRRPITPEPQTPPVEYDSPF